MDTPEDDLARYEGKPLLVLLENYVLDCIGALEPDKRELARGIVQQVFGGGDDWRRTVREQLQLGDTIDASLRGMWQRNLERAQEHGVELHPVPFARMVVDTNFAHLFDQAGE